MRIARCKLTIPRQVVKIARHKQRILRGKKSQLQDVNSEFGGKKVRVARCKLKIPRQKARDANSDF